MIKINLLGVAPRPSRTPSMGPPAPKATQILVFLGALVICFGIVGIIYKVLDNQLADLGKARNRERVRQSELAVVQAQNATYQQRLTDLETRINTIQALQNGRVGPVELMSQIGHVVDRISDVYLYTVSPSGDRLQLKGQSGTVDAMANFLSFLQKSGSFEDVQLEQFYQDDQHDRMTYKFTLSCLFKPSTGGTSPTVAGVPASPGGAPVRPAGSPGSGLPSGTPAPVQPSSQSPRMVR
jgi:Tfp pilus assembly protein PilN